jgi:hypothetical protein
MNGAGQVNWFTFPNTGAIATSGQNGNVRVWSVAKSRWLLTSGASLQHFMSIGHTLLALLFGFLGGQLSCFLYGKHADEEP